jgi:hypothetical protein
LVLDITFFHSSNIIITICIIIIIIIIFIFIIISIFFIITRVLTLLHHSQFTTIYIQYLLYLIQEPSILSLIFHFQSDVLDHSESLGYRRPWSQTDSRCLHRDSHLSYHASSRRIGRCSGRGRCNGRWLSGCSSHWLSGCSSRCNRYKPSTSTLHNPRLVTMLPPTSDVE